MSQYFRQWRLKLPEKEGKKTPKTLSLLVPSSVGNCNYITLKRSYEVKHFSCTLLGIQSLQRTVYGPCSYIVFLMHPSANGVYSVVMQKVDLQFL